MSVCEWCDQEMEDRVGCTGNLTVDFPDGESLPSMPNDGSLNDESGVCHDCGAPVGQAHHPGCDAERCPRCGGQLIGCGCLDEPEGLEA